MTSTDRPRIRPLEMVPLGDSSEGMFALRDPYGFSGTAALPAGAAVLVTLMNGERTLGELRQAFERQVGQSLSLTDVEQLVKQLDESYFLDNERFAVHEAEITAAYRALDVRPAAHAGGAYEGDVDALQTQLGELFTCEQGPGLLPSEGNTNDDFPAESDGRLCGVMSPHIDFHRGGPAFAWAYDRVVCESDADIFLIFGTAHTPLDGLFSISRKHFDTPLGTVRTDRDFLDALGGNLNAARMFDDELPHRGEHSIEFQALMLQYALSGRRDFAIVPILVGSFHQFVTVNRSPGDFAEVADFVAALRETIAGYGKKVCSIAVVDLAHIGQQFGDADLLDNARLTEQWADDQHLLAAACAGDAEAWFIHVAAQQDRNRICGLAPTYTMLETIRPDRGELLKYDQAVADDRSSCVSFASAAFYV